MARIQSARRHGPFDPRYVHGTLAPRASRLPDVERQHAQLREPADLPAVAFASWEDEGGAL